MSHYTEDELNQMSVHVENEGLKTRIEILEQENKKFKAEIEQLNLQVEDIIYEEGQPEVVSNYSEEEQQQDT